MTSKPIYITLHPKRDLRVFNCLQTPQIVFLVALFIAIVVANTAILLSIVTSSAGRKSRMKFFIMHLAIAGINDCLLQTIRRSRQNVNKQP